MADASARNEQDFWARSARAYLKTLTKTQPSPKVFRFSYLPDELQSNILRHTNLFASHELRWDSRRQALVCHGWFYPIEDGEDELEPERLRTGVCRSWKLPSALFLVNRKLEDEVTRIFYSENKFAVLSEGGRITITQASPSHVGVLGFLSRLPSNGFKYLRSLEIVLPNFCLDYLYPGEPGLCDWTNTAKFLKSHSKDRS